MNNIDRSYGNTYFYIKPVNSDTEIILIFNILLSSVELFPLVNVLPASGASHIEGGHESYSVLTVFGQFHTGDLRGIEVRRIVFLET